MFSVRLFCLFVCFSAGVMKNYCKKILHESWRKGVVSRKNPLNIGVDPNQRADTHSLLQNETVSVAGWRSAAVE